MPGKVKAKKVAKAARVSRATKTKVTAVGQLPMTSFTQLILATVTFWLSGTIIFLLANMVAPRDVVLGTNLISPTMAAVYAGGVVALVGVSAIPVIEFMSVELKLRLSNMHWMLLYLVINTGAVYLVSRFSELVGMGISMASLALILGAVLDLVQGWLMTSVVSKSK